MKIFASVILLSYLCGFAYADQPEATSLLGKPLYAPELTAETKSAYEKNLQNAKLEFEKNPNPDTLIWLGRRTGYIGRFKEAIEIFTKGIQQYPNDARFYRHRGHRYLTIREIDKAIADFEKAVSLIRNKSDEVEPDGIPNEKNIPTSTLHTNIWYHLGLAYYLKTDFAKASNFYRECLKISKNDDMHSATAHWLYMTLRRLNRKDEAESVLKTIRKDMNIIENFEYHSLLMMYKGEKTPDDLFKQTIDDLSNSTIGYGIANWYFYNGKTQQAFDMMKKVIAGKMWPAFGYLAAEAELSRSER